MCWPHRVWKDWKHKSVFWRGRGVEGVGKVGGLKWGTGTLPKSTKDMLYILWSYSLCSVRSILTYLHKRAFGSICDSMVFESSDSWLFFSCWPCAPVFGYVMLYAPESIRPCTIAWRSISPTCWLKRQIGLARPMWRFSGNTKKLANAIFLQPGDPVNICLIIL